jgi:hypothetical protein
MIIIHRVKNMKNNIKKLGALVEKNNFSKQPESSSIND